MANRSKQKGDREERRIVNLLRTEGFECERTLESGARSDGTPTHDINLLFPHHKRMKGECKHQERIVAYLWDWLEGNDFVTVRKNNKEAIWIFPEDVAIELLKARRDS